MFVCNFSPFKKIPILFCLCSFKFNGHQNCSQLKKHVGQCCYDQHQRLVLLLRTQFLALPTSTPTTTVLNGSSIGPQIGPEIGPQIGPLSSESSQPMSLLPHHEQSVKLTMAQCEHARQISHSLHEARHTMQLRFPLPEGIYMYTNQSLHINVFCSIYYRYSIKWLKKFSILNA